MGLWWECIYTRALAAGGVWGELFFLFSVSAVLFVLILIPISLPVFLGPLPPPPFFALSGTHGRKEQFGG